MADALVQTYWQVPVITRSYMTACFLTTLASQLGFVTVLQLYFNATLIFNKLEAWLWRVITTFVYFGDFGLDFVFHMFFMVRYCRMLEEGAFRGRTSDFLWMMLFGAAGTLILAPFFGLFFLGLPLTYMVVYIWSRKNPHVRMGFLGLLNFDAPWLPWFLIGLSLLLGHDVITDIIGLAIGHIYYFLEDVYARPVNQGGLGGPRLLKAPAVLQWLFDRQAEEVGVEVPVAERPGGFQWGDGQRLGGVM